MNTYTNFQLKILIFICLILFFVKGISAQENGLTIYPSDLSSSIFAVDDGINSINSQFKLSKFATGEPDIIAISALVLLPKGINVNVSVTSGTYELYSDGYIHPVPPNVKEGSDESLPPESEYINNAIYSSTSLFPGKFYDFIKLGSVRGHDLGILYIYPYQYNPAEEKTYVYSEIGLEVTYDGTINSLPENLLSEFDPIETKPINYDPIETVVINYDQIINLELNVTTTLKSAQTYEEGCEFLIITNDILLPAAEKLKQYRISRGIDTKIKSFSGTILPSDVESYIDYCYNNMDPIPKYILLLGDTDIIPVSDKLTGKTTDLPYFDIDDGSPMLPDFSSGRIPVSTLTEANTWIDKIITYEEIPADDPFFSSASLISFFRPVEDGCGTEYFRYIKTCEDLATEFRFRDISFDRLYYSDQNNIQEYTYIPAFLMRDDKLSAPVPADIEMPNSEGFTWDSKNTDIIQSINADKFLIIHRGHGSTDAWGTNKFLQFSSSDITSLNNAAYPSVVWSLNCLTGKFDGAEDCIAEKLGKYTNGGAVGIVAATDETETIYNDYLAHGLASAIWPEFQALRKGSTIPAEKSYNYLRMGDILRNALLNLVNVNSATILDEGAKNHIRSYHWLGDPTMEILPDILCQSSLDLDTTYVTSGNSVLYKNYEEIFVDDIFTAESGANVEFIAGSRIVFEPGVLFKSGSSVKASTRACEEIVDVQSQKSALYNNTENENDSQNKSIKNQQEEDDLIVYPNPSDGKITIIWKKEVSDAVIRIYNHTGKLVLVKQLSNSSEQLDITRYGSGIYLVRLFAGNTYYDKRIIVY